jgi:hypothetical protein
MPIVCTEIATQGLRARSASSLVVASTPDEMSRAITAVWRSPDYRERLGAAARGWVTQHHAWTTTAREAIAAVEESVARGDAR